MRSWLAGTVGSVPGWVYVILGPLQTVAADKVNGAANRIPNNSASVWLAVFWLNRFVRGQINVFMLADYWFKGFALIL
jgi:hypothetical protein